MRYNVSTILEGMDLASSPGSNFDQLSSATNSTTIEPKLNDVSSILDFTEIHQDKDAHISEEDCLKLSGIVDREMRRLDMALESYVVKNDEIDMNSFVNNYLLED